MTKNPMIGKVLVNVFIAQDRGAIKFVLAGGEEVVARFDGDCCSYTWCEHVEIPDLPGTVLKIEDIAMPDVEPPGGKYVKDPESVAFYGLKITLSTGHLVIDYRNDSNGYYGGSISWPHEDYFYGGVHGQNRSNEIWVEAKEG